MARRTRYALAATLVAALLSLGGWYGLAEYRQYRFVADLHLVGFSTSMIGSPRPEQEQDTQRQAAELGIDLFAAYQNNLRYDARFDLAWLLITQESPEYLNHVREHVAEAPWPEVRIWSSRRRDASLSPEYRQELLALLLASPTSEAKLAAARWHKDHGDMAAAESAWHEAMTKGAFWDALDAADQLLKSEHYRTAALQHHLEVVRDSEHFTSRAAQSLLRHYNAFEECQSLVDGCKREPRDGPNRRALVERIEQLMTAVTPDTPG